MQRITFVNSRGEQLTLGSTRPYILLKVDGAGVPETEIQMQKAPYQDGQTYIDTLMMERLIDLEVVILASTQAELYEYRRGLAKIFNPKTGIGRLRYETSLGIKEIYAAVQGSPVFSSGELDSGYQRVLLSLICPNPFWLDIYTESEDMAAWLGGLTFALSFPTSFAEQGNANNKIINNDGDVETPIIIEFFGPASNPAIENNTTGEFIRIKRDIQSGEKLVINTAFGNKSVKLVQGDTEVNALHWIDLDSTFWQLIPGGNYVSYSADAGAEDAWVKLTWRNRYVGV